MQFDETNARATIASAILARNRSPIPKCLRSRMAAIFCRSKVTGMSPPTSPSRDSHAIQPGMN